ncbi:MAG: UDP-N-acetylmuramoyl-tripeptide--D-alanyl-D-alanine ligase, partial [Muribaculaceae bacterium]|nr:UDP-N-acetylmuramoyl-tripeptide--D-alanyl-D-alanine ligase [Muribaculaceae bacterium]
MNAFSIIIYVICGLYMLLNFKHDIHMLQQNSYRIDRYWKWLNRSGDISSASRLVNVGVLFLLFSTLLMPAANAMIVAAACCGQAIVMLRKKFKKPLVFTPRVKRIYSVCGIIAIAASLSVILKVGRDGNNAFLYYSGGQVSLGTILLCCIFSWAIAIAAVWILKPLEASINAKYRNEAVSILRSMPQLKIVGITGSYGKTSTKHYLQRILSERYDVLMTPGSYNTPMGVIRTVREMMKPYNEVFICEMGAKQLGDIKEICDMVHPQIGIVTAVGPMHLESFKSLENVQKTKFEIIDALPADGFGVINNDFEWCANHPVDNVKVARYGVSNTKDCDYIASNIAYSPDGTDFVVEGKDGTHLDLHTRLVGECNISNLVAAVIVALHVGLTPDEIRRAVDSIDQVEHRLNVKRTPGGVTIIDDAFNSNPAGSRMAVDVLSQFKTGKRIIVTPGMIELGSEQENLNRELGKHIGENVDVAVIVGAYNRNALVDGIRSTDFNENNLHIVDSFADSQTLLSKILAPGDTVLYEND